MRDFQTCYLCGEVSQEVLQDHHVIPRKLVTTEADAARDDTGETVVVCANCHQKIHHLLEPTIQFLTEKIREGSTQELRFETASDLHK